MPGDTYSAKMATSRDEMSDTITNCQGFGFFRESYWQTVSSPSRVVSRNGLRRAGVDVADIQELYGHTDPETTLIYARSSLKKHHAAIDRLSA